MMEGDFFKKTFMLGLFSIGALLAEFRAEDLPLVRTIVVVLIF